MEFIRSFLVDYLKKKIDLVRKRNFDNPYICFGHSDEVVLFRNVYSKDFYSNDDINDLLICFSDHLMDDYELLAFVSNSPYIFYEMDEASTNIDIRNIILLYLLQSNDFDIILGVFKLFSINLLELVENDDISLYFWYRLYSSKSFRIFSAFSGGTFFRSSSVYFGGSK